MEYAYPVIVWSIIIILLLYLFVIKPAEKAEKRERLKEEERQREEGERQRKELELQREKQRKEREHSTKVKQLQNHPLVLKALNEIIPYIRAEIKQAPNETIKRTDIRLQFIHVSHDRIEWGHGERIFFVKEGWDEMSVEYQHALTDCLFYALQKVISEYPGVKIYKSGLTITIDLTALHPIFNQW